MGCAQPETPAVIYNDQAIADESRTAEWLAYGGAHNERRFSPITDINLKNVNDLKVDWFMDLPNDVGLVHTTGDRWHFVFYRYYERFKSR